MYSISCWTNIIESFYPLLLISETRIRHALKMVGDYKSEGHQLMQTLLHAPRPRQRRAAETETGRFVHTGNDTTINLIPGMTLVLLSIAGMSTFNSPEVLHNLNVTTNYFSICLCLDWITWRSLRQSALHSSSQGGDRGPCSRWWENSSLYLFSFNSPLS